MRKNKNCITCDIPYTKGVLLGWKCPTQCKTSDLENWKKRRKIHINPFFRWYDIWIGLYIDKDSKTIYFCPLPMIGLKIKLK